MIEKRFTLAYEKGNWWAVKDGDITLWKEETIALLNSLNDENEQLKQRNDKQCTQLKQLWELIEDEDYNTLRSMLNQRETDEKLLQKEWRTYSD